MHFPNQIKTRGFLALVSISATSLYIYSAILESSHLKSNKSKTELDEPINQKEDIYKIFHLPATALILPFNKTTVLEPPSQRSTYCHPDRVPYLVLLMFISSPENFERRSLIRKEILKQKLHVRLNTGGIAIGHLFFLGQSTSPNFSMDDLFHEGLKNEDMVIDDFSESYLNLTLKSLRMLKWVRQNCPETPFVVKIDDDVYFNLGILVSYLQGISDPANLLAGHVVRNSKPVDNPESKFYTPNSIWPRDTPFPAYASGVFYVLGVKTREVLYQGALLSTITFHMEDVFITGIVREQYANEIQVSEIPGLVTSYQNQIWWLWWPCEFYGRVVALHPLDLRKLECFLKIEYFCDNRPYTPVQFLC